RFILGLILACGDRPRRAPTEVDYTARLRPSERFWTRCIVSAMAPKVDPALASRVPPGQILTAKWPVLPYGRTPRFDPARWTFRCYGLVEHEMTWTWSEFAALPRVTITSDIHCVTRWSKLDNVWEGVSIREILDRVKPLPEARFVMQHADPDYTTNIALDDLLQEDVILALKHNGRDLEPDHGGPMRLAVPK